jgi:PAS domain S-box-containing protein
MSSLERTTDLLAAVARIQSRFIHEADSRSRFDETLQVLLRLTDSEYGFIGEVLNTPDGRPYLKTQAITNIAWDDATRAFYEQYAPQGLEFKNLETLFGAVITSNGAVIANNPLRDPRRGGTPPGHPPLKAFLGIPFHRDGKLVGMVGIANRPGGYDEALVKWLEPLCTTCAVMIVADRNERHRREAEAALREERERYHHLFENTPIAIWEEDFTELGAWLHELRAKGVRDLRAYLAEEPGRLREALARIRAVRVNQAAVRQNAAASQQELLEALPQLFTERTYECFTEELVALWEGWDAGEREFEFESRRLDGSLLHVIVRIYVPRTNGKPDLTRVIVSATDVTERKQVEAALLASEERYRLACQVMRNFAYLVHISATGETRFEWVTPGLQQIMGYEADEAAKNWTQIVCPEDLPATWSAIEELRAGRQNAFEFRAITKSGEIRWLRGSSQPLSRTADGEVSALGAIVDVTEQKYAELELRQRQAELFHVSRLSSLGQMVAAISHEIAQPLSAMNNFAAACMILLDSQSALPRDTLQRHLREMAEEGRRAGAILEQIRGFVRKAPPHRSTCELNALLRQSLELMASELRQRAVTVHADFGQPDIRLLVDRVQIQQLVVNLLNNACDALRDAAATDKCVTIRSRAKGESAVIEVEDRGAGLPKDHAQRLFQPFYTTKRDGLGMGLSICKAIVDSHGGKIEAEPNVRGGATFRVTLPIV